VARYRYGRRIRSRIVTVVSDTFTRTDNASSMGSAETGQTWTAASGTWGISGNLAYPAVAVAGDHVTVPAVGDGLVECDVLAADYAIGTPGVMFRYIDASNYLFVRRDAANLLILKIDAGVGSTLVTTANAAVNGQTYRMGVRMRGVDLQVFQDGVQITALSHTLIGANATKYTAAAGTIAGLRAAGSAPTSCRWDNFRVTR
jgi:hypothetical protein